MTRYLHVYRTPSGQWSGKVLEEVAGIAGCEHPVDVLLAAREQFPGIEDLPQDAPAPCFDDDGEPLEPPPFITRPRPADPIDDMAQRMTETLERLESDPQFHHDMSKRGF